MGLVFNESSMFKSPQGLRLKKKLLFTILHFLNSYTDKKKLFMYKNLIKMDFDLINKL